MRRPSSWFFGGFFLALLPLLGCDGDVATDGEEEPFLLTIEEGPLAGASVEVPHGAFDDLDDIALELGEDIELDDATLIGPAVKLRPDGAEFDDLVTVTLPFDPNTFPPGFLPEDIVVLWRDDETGDVQVRAPLDVDFFGGRLLVQTLSFSTAQAAVTSTHCANDAFENNDDIYTSSLITNLTMPIKGLRLCPGDADWYRINVPGGKRLNVELRPTTSGDFVIGWLETKQWTRGLRTDNGAVDWISYDVPETVSSETLYISTKQFIDDVMGTGMGYSLKATIERSSNIPTRRPCDSDDSYEDNDTYATATVLTDLNTTLTGLRFCDGDQDHYRFTVPRFKQVDIEVRNAYSEHNMLWIYSKTDNITTNINCEVANDGPEKQWRCSHRIRYVETEDREFDLFGTLFIDDEAGRGSDYQIKLTSGGPTPPEPCTAPDDYLEENDSYHQATPVLEEGLHNAQHTLRACALDEDWLHVPLPPGVSLSTRLTTNRGSHVGFWMTDGRTTRDSALDYSSGSLVQEFDVAASETEYRDYRFIIKYFVDPTPEDGVDYDIAFFLSATLEPVPTADYVTNDEDTPTLIDVMRNDIVADGETLSLTSVTTPGHGAAVIESGEVRYTPTANFNGDDSFDYTVTDSAGYSATETVSVTVTGVADPPEVNDDSLLVSEDSSALIDVLANDSDLDGETLSIASFTQPAHGVVADAGGGELRYTPTADFFGSDSFTYEAEGGLGLTATGTVSVTVGGENDPPHANDDSASTGPGMAVMINVLANDVDADGETLAVTITVPPANGSAIVNADGSVTYTPAAGFTGDDAFAYRVEDAAGESDSATVTIAVYSGNHPPVANPDAATTDEDVAVTIAVTANDSDPDLDAIFIDSVGTASHGTVAILPGDTEVRYTPEANWNGTDSFDYVLTDSPGATATATVTVEVVPVEDAPIAVDDTATTAADARITIDVLANDSDPEGDSLTIVSVEDPPHGTTVITADDQIEYTPDIGYIGSDSFAYDIEDVHGNGDFAAVTVTILAAPDACHHLVCDGDGCAMEPINCGDDDACTTDSCDPAVGCINTTITCDDGDACTEDSCDPIHGCQTTVTTCDDGDACTTDSCDSATGCQTTPITCDDGDACTTDSCDPATGCQTAPITCDDGDACTTDGCDATTGCWSDPIVCDDEDACTTDSCDSELGCQTTPITCDDGDPCTVDACDAALGCVTSPTDCDDGDACTLDSCDPVEGCVTSPITCDDGRACSVDSCDPATGCVYDASGCIETECDDELDNDDDELIDCDDPDCIADYYCFPGCDDDVHENNDDFVAAWPAWYVPDYPDPISVWLDDDYYRVFLCAGGTLTAQILETAESTGDDMDLFLYDDTYTFLTSSEGPSATERIDWISTYEGYAYLRVEMMTPAGCSPYQLDAVTTDCPGTSPESDCSDDIDNDFDGTFDCYDSDCATDFICAESGPRYTCSRTEYLTVGDPTRHEHTMMRWNEHSGSCVASSGEEAVWELSEGLGGTVCVHTRGSSIPTTLYVRRDDCEGGLEMACNSWEPGADVQVEVEIEGGRLYYVFVDSFPGEAGHYALTFVDGPCELCAGGADEDGDLLVDCDDPDCELSVHCL